MKKLVFGVIFIAAAVCLQAQNLSWEIKLYREKTNEYIPIPQIIRGENGEAFQVYITPYADCFCYMVCYDSERRQVSVWYNEPMKEGKEDYVTMGIDEGTVILYVIMSLKRQTQLENLIKSHNSNPNSRQVHQEVVRLQAEVSRSGEPASSFIASGGTSRGSSEEYATRFTGKEIYVRAISFSH